MKNHILSVSTILLLTNCADLGPEPSEAFGALEAGQLEVRLAKVPELEPEQCNRNLFAGFQSDDGTPIRLNLDMLVKAPGTSTQRYSREWVLGITADKNLLVGQTALFPEPVEKPCNEVELELITLSCAYDNEKEVSACPANVRWQWLNGFKMVRVPKTK